MTTAATLALQLRAPLDLPAALRPLARWGDDGLDRWDGRLLLRTVRPAGGEPLAFAAQVAGSVDRPRLDLVFERAVDEEPAASAVRGTFDTDPGARRAALELARSDPAVRALVERYPGFAPVLFRDPLTALIRSISAQQVNLRWATEVRGRLARRYGRRHEVAGEWVMSLDPPALAAATVEELRVLQLTTAKARSVIACARAAADGALEPAALTSLEDGELVERLTALPGIGRWSAEWFLARTLGRPRVVAGDLGVRKAVGRMYASATVPAEAEVRRLTAHWGPAAALVQALALHDLGERPAARSQLSPRPSSPQLPGG